MAIYVGTTLVAGGCGCPGSGGGSVPGTPAAVLDDPTSPNTVVTLDSSGQGESRTYAAVRQTMGLSPRAVATPAPLLWYPCTSRVVTDTTVSNAGSLGAANASLVDMIAGANGPWGAPGLQVRSGFNGYAQAPVDLARPTTALTICLWFRLSSSAPGRLFQRSYDTVWAPPFIAVDLYVDGAGIVSGGIAVSGVESRVGGATQPIARIAEWHHAGLTYDGSNLRLYLDGVNVATAAYAGSIDYGPSPAATRWVFGGNNITPESIVGEVCDARVFDVVLSAAQVAELAGLYP